MLVEYQATKGWSEYTMTQLARAGQNIQLMTQSGKVKYVILNQNDPCNCVTSKQSWIQRSLELKMYIHSVTKVSLVPVFKEALLT